ncbi:hypothetical protein DPMN_177114 [Dreissena polymorpha]|uniref:Uncharacterized protein n=1 Tax=Dreissena polymorpha TaxID=45954 RepID=A0A9D4ECA0_DREPO|nr:hypothetical protein DPMN_177071 [Dreissena polymorpha]KAH3775709.1 hypothetical protein DPMN_177114 [Dreissena polymorpha]
MRSSVLVALCAVSAAMVASVHGYYDMNSGMGALSGGYGYGTAGYAIAPGGGGGGGFGGIFGILIFCKYIIMR